MCWSSLDSWYLLWPCVGWLRKKKYSKCLVRGFFMSPDSLQGGDFHVRQRWHYFRVLYIQLKNLRFNQLLGRVSYGGRKPPLDPLLTSLGGGNAYCRRAREPVASTTTSIILANYLASGFDPRQSWIQKVTWFVGSIPIAYRAFKPFCIRGWENILVLMGSIPITPGIRSTRQVTQVNWWLWVQIPLPAVFGLFWRSSFFFFFFFFDHYFFRFPFAAILPSAILPPASFLP